MYGVRLTFVASGTGVPPSPEVLRQAVVETARRSSVAIEHIWSGTTPAQVHVVVYLSGLGREQAMAQSRILGQSVEQGHGGIAFAGVTPVNP
jgi:hypothetical protein